MMAVKNRAKQFPNYKTPPVTEVVCSLAFEPLERLSGPYFGEYWRLVKDRFPVVEEKSPLASVDDAGESLDPDLSKLFYKPRIWFISKSDASLIQAQHNRFVFNWRKRDEATGYPRFSAVFGSFVSELEIFQAFLKKEELGQITPKQFELTYVNQIPSGKSWEDLGDLSRVFKAFDGSIASGKFLPAPMGLAFNLNYQLPEKSGRLFVKVESAVRNSDRLPVLQVTMLARGIGSKGPLRTVEGWFELAHEWIVRGFDDLTSESIQCEEWK